MARPKLTKEIVNERLKADGTLSRMMSEYVNTRTKSRFKCLVCDNEWFTKPKPGAGSCPKCSIIRVSNSRKLSKQEVNDRLEATNRTVRMIGEYVSNLTKSLFKCLVCDNEWLVKPNSVLSSSQRGCPRCADTRLSTEIMNERLEADNRTLRMIGGYTTALTKSLFKCLVCDNEWLVTPNNVLRSRGCPNCAEYGYRIDEPGYLYILDFGDYIKYGITNNLKGRLNDHKKNGHYIVAMSKLYEDGSIPLNWEKNIKIIFGGRFVTKERCTDGYTETLCVSKLSELLKTLP